MVILKELEMKIKLREAVIARMPVLKSFLTNKSVTVAALEALNKLVINDGHKSSQWEMFEKIPQDKGKTKKTQPVFGEKVCQVRLFGCNSCISLGRL